MGRTAHATKLGSKTGAPARGASPSAARRPKARWTFDAGPGAALAAVGAQPALEVGAPHDEFEKEADRVAERVMRMPAPPAGAPPPKKGESDEDRVQRKMEDDELGPGPPIVRRACATCADDEKKVQGRTEGMKSSKSDEEEGTKVQRQEKVELPVGGAEDFFKEPPEETEVAQRACMDCDEDKQKPTVQRGMAREDEEKKAQTKVAHEDDWEDEPTGVRRREPVATTAFEEGVRTARRGGGQPLPDVVRHFLEPRFGRDLGGVRVHTGMMASQLARDVRARAFTVGRHLFFRQGEIQPSTDQGRHLIAHELTHVMQQQGGLHSVQRELFEPEAGDEEDASRRSKSETETRAEERERLAQKPVDFKKLQKLFGWREGLTSPQVLEIIHEMIQKALHSLAAMEKLGVFAGGEPPASLIRRTLRSESHELRLETRMAGGSKQAEASWELKFVDGTRVPATGQQSVEWNEDAAGVDDDVVDVGSTGRPAEPAEPGADIQEVKAKAPPTPAPTESTTDTTVGAPATAGLEKAKETGGAPEGRAPAAPEEAVEGAEAAAGAAPGVAAEGAKGAPMAGAVGAAGAEAGVPRSPEEDPNFQAVETRAGAAAKQSSGHSEAGGLATNAKDAAEPQLTGEVRREAEAKQVDQMKAQPTPAFSKEQFIKDVLAEVEKTTPKNLKDAKDYKPNNKAGEVQRNVRAETQAETDRTRGPLKKTAEAEPNTAAVTPRDPADLKPERVGEAPPDVEAGQAVPPTRPAAQVEGALDHNKEVANAELQKIGVPKPEESLANSGEPTFTAALDAKNKVDADAEQGKQEFRAGEEGLRGEAQGQSAAHGTEALAGMVGSRADLINKVVGQQTHGKKKSETTRESVTKEVNGIYQETKTKVETRLAKLETEVFKTFDTEAAAVFQRFQDRIADAERRWEEKGFFGRAAEEIGSFFTSMPTELEADLRAIRARFIEEMRAVVEKIAERVATELTAAKAEVDDGKKRVEDRLNSLPASLGGLKEELSKEFNQKFATLEKSIKDARNRIVKGTAQRYTETLKKGDELLAQVRERNKGLVGEFIGAIAGVIQTYIDLKNKLLSVFAQAEDVILRIIADPITFAKNLFAGIGQGLRQFGANVLNHLKKGVLEWLTGTVASTGIQLPATFDAQGIFSLVLQILGLTVDNIKARARVIWGPEVVDLIERGVAGFEKAVELFNILRTEGLAGLWRLVKEKLVGFKDQLIGELTQALSIEVVAAAIQNLLSLLTPASAVVQAVIKIVNVVLFFIQNASRFAALAETIIGAVRDILGGNITALANKVESVLASAIPIVIDFLAALIGIGGRIVGVIKSILAKITQPIQKAIDAVLTFIKKMFLGIVAKAKAFLAIGQKPEQPGAQPGAAQPQAPTGPMKPAQVEDQVFNVLSQPVDTDDAAQAIAQKQTQADTLRADFQKVLPQGQTLSIKIGRNAVETQKAHAVDFTVGAARVGKAPLKAGADRFEAGVEGVKSELTELAPLDQEAIKGAIPGWIQTFGFKTLMVQSKGEDEWEIDGEMSPRREVTRFQAPGTRKNPFPLEWPKPASGSYPTLFFGGPIGRIRSQKELQSDVGKIDETGNKIRAYTPHVGGTLPGGAHIGITEANQVAVGTIVGPASEGGSPGGGKLLDALQPYGFVAKKEGLDGDHVREIQLGGKDTLGNLWPLDASTNRAAGSILSQTTVQYPRSGKQVMMSELKKRTRKYFFMITKTR